MNKKDIDINDWQRILIGDVPYTFFIEVAIRVTVIFLLLLVSMRFLGKRLPSMLNRNDRVTIASLAAAIGIPLQTPDRGLLPAVVVALTVIGLHRVTNLLVIRSGRFQRFSQGKIETLIENGVIRVTAINKTHITRERILSELRSKGIAHLGVVDRLYVESSGSFTLIRNKQEEPGLSVLPLADNDFYDEHEHTDHQVCSNCGKEQVAPAQPCINCGNRTFVQAIR
jgi:uncharacterized membrane protein YcaP (DUF421 family)